MCTLRQLVLSTIAVLSLATPARAVDVSIKDGNVVFSSRWNQRRQLTQSGKDSNPVLSPDGNWIAFTRMGDHSNDGDDASPNCKSGAKADELRRIRVDGSREELLYRGRKDEHGNICSFDTKQFTSDGRYIYFLSPGWVTSYALHRFDFQTKSAEFVTDANNVIVLNDCNNAEYRDGLLVLQHRYFVGGGSYDWYWLYKRDEHDVLNGDGVHRIYTDPVGEFERGADARASLTFCNS